VCKVVQGSAEAGICPLISCVGRSKGSNMSLHNAAPSAALVVAAGAVVVVCSRLFCWVQLTVPW